mmetsp:Transcript_4310/g.15086  ORF Transcript_4310/g.15086 Transcript_4310/m.15086 type:complete len:277 (-) Transcript_4310:494-1324(-)
MSARTRNMISSCMRSQYSLLWGSMHCSDLKYSSSRRSTYATMLPWMVTGLDGSSTGAFPEGAFSSASSPPSGLSSSAVSITVMCGFSFSTLMSFISVWPHLRHSLTGMCVLIDGLTSNCALTTCRSTCTVWLVVFATLARYVSWSTCSILSVPFLPRLMMMSLSFFCTISYVMSLGSMLLSLAFSFSALVCMRSSTAVSAAVVPSPVAPSSASSSSSSLSLSLSLPSSSGASRAACSSASISRLCFFSFCRVALNALAFVGDIFFFASLFSNVALT